MGSTLLSSNPLARKFAIIISGDDSDMILSNSAEHVIGDKRETIRSEMSCGSIPRRRG